MKQVLTSYMSLVLKRYFKNLYQDAIGRAYLTAYEHISSSTSEPCVILDCGASDGRTFEVLSKEYGLNSHQYKGIEWSGALVLQGQAKGLDIEQGDLNKILKYEDESFSCIYGLSVLEHLLNPCHYLQECYRLLQPGGKLVLLTPNISTYFTLALILTGKMPSSGPHPDSNRLVKSEEIFKVSNESVEVDTEGETPPHRHLVVFSYIVLKKYLDMLGFVNVKGHGFGLYPFPKIMQGVLEKIDPYHCHQMVFIAYKP